jgi:DNA transformation protein
MPRKPERIRPFREKPDARCALQGALNLGPKSAGWLIDTGIHSLDQVRKLGPIETCRQLHAAGHPVSVVMAYALEGALTDCHWNEIPREAKEFLRIEFARMKNRETS